MTKPKRFKTLIGAVKSIAPDLVPELRKAKQEQYCVQLVTWYKPTKKLPDVDQRVVFVLKGYRDEVFEGNWENNPYYDKFMFGDDRGEYYYKSEVLCWAALESPAKVRK